MLAVVFSAAANAEDSQFLCQADEQLIFGCAIGDELVSICASPDVTSDSGYMQYRFGNHDHIELVYPSNAVPPRGHFYLSTVGYSGGGGASIRFVNNGHEYVVFDLMVRTNFVSGEPNYPASNAGVVTRRDGVNTSVRLCNDTSASVRVPSYDAIPREKYDPDIVPVPMPF